MARLLDASAPGSVGAAALLGAAAPGAAGFSSDAWLAARALLTEAHQASGRIQGVPGFRGRDDWYRKGPP